MKSKTYYNEYWIQNNLMIPTVASVLKQHQPIYRVFSLLQTQTTKYKAIHCSGVPIFALNCICFSHD